MLAVIFIPKSFGQMGSYLLYHQRQHTVLKGSLNEIELDMLELKKGVNFVSPETWKAVSEHGQNNTVLRAMQKKQALFVYEPDAASPVGSTADFDDLMVVEDILQHTTDSDWISRSLARDNRPEVFTMGSKRIKEIQEDLESRRQKSLTMELAS